MSEMWIVILSVFAISPIVYWLIKWDIRRWFMKHDPFKYGTQKEFEREEDV